VSPKHLLTATDTLLRSVSAVSFDSASGQRVTDHDDLERLRRQLEAEDHRRDTWSPLRNKGGTLATARRESRSITPVAADFCPRPNCVAPSHFPRRVSL
jgi:hypothetical protein